MNPIHSFFTQSLIYLSVLSVAKPLANAVNIEVKTVQATNTLVELAQSYEKDEQSFVKTAQAANTQAELTYAYKKDRDGFPRWKTVHLKIVRAGQVLLDQQLPTKDGFNTHPYRFWVENSEGEEEPLQVQDLDGDREPEVIVDLFTGNPHCCFYSLIYHFAPQQNRYTYIEHYWGDIAYKLADLDKDGIPEFSSLDNRFAYKFSSFADSFFPLQIRQYRQGKMLDVTRQHPTLILSHSKQLWQEYVERHNNNLEEKGVLAAYLADQYLLGQGQGGWQRIHQVYQGSDRQEYFNQLQSFLRDSGYTGDKPPQAQEIAESQRREIEEHKRLLQIVGGLGMAEEAHKLSNIGSVYASAGQYQKALDFLNQALSLARNLKNSKEEAFALISIGKVYSDLGQYEQALDYTNQALVIFQTAQDSKGEAAALNNIGLNYIKLGKFEQAINYLKQALPLFQGAEEIKATILNNMGGAYLELGKYEQASNYFNQALSLSQAAGHTLGEATALNNVGFAYLQSGKYEQASNYFNQALPLRQAVGDRSGEVTTLYGIAYLERGRGNLNEALTQIEAVIKIIESLRTKIASQELRTSYFASLQGYYEFYIDLLMQLHKRQPSKGYDALALQASERARARSLLEILTEANADIHQGVEPRLLEQERTLQQQLDALEKRRLELHSGNHTQAAAALETEHANLLAQYREVREQIRATSPRYANLKYPQPLTLPQIQQQVLDDDTLLLEYSLGEEKSYLWAVTKTSIASYELPKRQQLEAAARKFYQHMTVPKLRNRPYQIARLAANLSRMLLQPVAAQLGKQRLIIVADGALQYLPLGALPIPAKAQTARAVNPIAAAKPLLAEHEVVSLPSASALAVLRQEITGRKPAPKTVAVLADPVFSQDDVRVQKTVATVENPTITASDKPLALQALERAASQSNVKFERLEWTQQEAEQILSLVPTHQQQQALGFAANRATATSPNLAQYRIVHFATHGILNSINPELSGVVLSLIDKQGNLQNGFLRLHDVFNLNLSAELVVLSACETGLGQEIRGEGLVGLTRGFMYAGAPRVVVSLWKVNDKATALLMAKFYKGMLEEGLRPAAALRTAQIEMSQHPQFSAPYFWAAFVLQGEWQ